MGKHPPRPHGRHPAEPTPVGQCASSGKRAKTRRLAEGANGEPMRGPLAETLRDRAPRGADKRVAAGGRSLTSPSRTRKSVGSGSLR